MSRPLRLELDVAEVARALAAVPFAMRELAAAMRVHLDATPEEFLDTDEAARLLHVTPGRVRRLIHERRLERVGEPGTRILIARSELDRYLAGSR